MADGKKAFDTTGDAAKVQLAALTRMDISSRANLTFELSDSLHEVVSDGLRHRHADYDEKMLRKEMIRLLFGREIYEEVFGESGARS
jgi:hypothetical protein